MLLALLLPPPVDLADLRDRTVFEWKGPQAPEGTVVDIRPLSPSRRAVQEFDYPQFDLIVHAPNGGWRSIPFGKDSYSDVCKFVGNPLRPPFVIHRAAPRRFVYDVILPGYVWHPRTYYYVRWVGRESIIAGQSLGSICRTQTKTGKVIWERELPTLEKITLEKRGIVVDIYFGNKHLLLSWRTGKTLQRLPR